MNKLIDNVLTWGVDKGILKPKNGFLYTKGQKLAQMSKTLEEVVELNTALINDNLAETKDAIGDIIVTLILQAEMNDLTIEECLQSAYDVISKRNGIMINGVFVKEKK